MPAGIKAATPRPASLDASFVSVTKSPATIGTAAARPTMSSTFCKAFLGNIPCGHSLVSTISSVSIDPRGMSRWAPSTPVVSTGAVAPGCRRRLMPTAAEPPQIMAKNRTQMARVLIQLPPTYLLAKSDLVRPEQDNNHTQRNHDTERNQTAS